MLKCVPSVMFYDLPADGWKFTSCRPGTRSQEGVINEEPCLPGAVFLGTAASLMCEAPEGFLQPPEQPCPGACVTLDPEQGWGDAPSGLCVSRSSAGGQPSHWLGGTALLSVF